MPRLIVLKTACLWLAFISSVCILGMADYITGHELNFFVFYFLPVAWAALRQGFVSAIVLSVLCAVSWAFADLLAGHAYSSPTYAIWNTTVRLCAFLTISWTVARISTLLHREREMSETLRITLAELKILEGLLPICAYCKKIRDDNGTWQQIELYITNHSQAHFSHGMCPECSRKLLADAGLSR